jgi:hypothetical protein
MSDATTPEPTDGRDEISDVVRADHEANETVTNDAVAGETVEPGAGDGNDGPTGGSPREAEPDAPVSDLADAQIDLDDEES